MMLTQRTTCGGESLAVITDEIDKASNGLCNKTAKKVAKPNNPVLLAPIESMRTLAANAIPSIIV